MLTEYAVLDDAVEELLAPCRTQLDDAMDRIPSSAQLHVGVGPTSGFYRLRGHELTLSDQLLGPSVSHPSESVIAMPPLDRWRRAAGCVLEALALNGLARTWRRPVEDDWRWLGAAIDLADRAAPELELAQPDLAMAIRTGDPGAHPRCGVAVYRHGRVTGESMTDRTGYLLTGGVISPKEWVDIGAWVLDPSGAGRALPVVVAHPEAVAPPAVLSPWSWRPVRVPAHERGGLVEVEGDGFVDTPWGVARRDLRTVAGATARGCSLVARSGGPVGRWELASAQGFGQVFGARGVSFHFHATGRLEVILADAFVGPLAAIAMAEELGTSGTAAGKWSVEGRFLLGFEGIASHGLTLHSRTGGGFMVPAGGFGLGEWLQALEDGHWAWQVMETDRLVMRGYMMGGAVEVRMKAT